VRQGSAARAGPAAGRRRKRSVSERDRRNQRITEKAGRLMEERAALQFGTKEERQEYGRLDMVSIFGEDTDDDTDESLVVVLELSDTESESGQPPAVIGRRGASLAGGGGGGGGAGDGGAGGSVADEETESETELGVSSEGGDDSAAESEGGEGPSADEHSA
jgi:hypothetical protein